MTVKDLVVRNRSFRRFLAHPRPGRERLIAWIECARLAASGGNRQPLRYWLVETPEKCAAVFPHTHWAVLLKGWSPAADEVPTGYILVLSVSGGATPHADAGIAMQTMLLAATEAGFGGCMLGVIERPAIKAVLGIPDELELLYVVAFGRPTETCLLEEAAGGNTAYYRTADGVHHVPKLPLETLIVSP